MNPRIYREALALGIVTSPWQGTVIYDEGRFDGHRAGRLDAIRDVCRQIVQHWHPRAGRKVWAALDRGTDEAALKAVACHAPEWTTRDILRRLPVTVETDDDVAQSSSIYQEGFAEGYSAGRLNATRELCREVVHHWHLRAPKKVWSAIWGCTNITTLTDVARNAAGWGTHDILQRLTGWYVA